MCTAARSSSSSLGMMDRHSFIAAGFSGIGYSVLVLLLSLPTAQAGGADPDERPNVLFLLVDDLGWSDVGFNNPSTFYETPNIDRLAAEGMRFSQAYAACPVCSPTRASVMTGCYPARLATTDFFGGPQPDSILEAGRRGDHRERRARSCHAGNRKNCWRHGSCDFDRYEQTSCDSGCGKRRCVDDQ